MSAVQPPPRKPVANVKPKEQEAPSRKESIHDQLAKLSVMTDCPPIHTNLSQTEAVIASKGYKTPPMVAGEIVFYREHKSSKEIHGMLSSESNGRYNLTVAVPGRGFERRFSVSWYDHTLGKAEAAAQCDPWAKYNNSGTFRRAPFSKVVDMLIDFLEKFDLEAVLELKAKVDKLTTEVAQLREKRS